MYHSVHHQFYPPGNGNHNPYFGYWRLPYGHNNNNNNMASTASSSPSDGPPPLIPIAQPADDSQDEGPFSPPPSLHERTGPSSNPITHMSSFVSQHAYAAVWESTSIARLNASHGVPAQGSVPQPRNPSAADRTQATAGPSRVNAHYNLSVPSIPANNGYAFSNNINNHPQAYKNLYQQSRQAEIQRQTVVAVQSHHPPRPDVPYSYFGNPSQNGQRYHTSNSTNETFFRHHGAILRQQHPAPPVSVSRNHQHVQSPQAQTACAPPVNAIRHPAHQPLTVSSVGEHEKLLVSCRKRKGSVPETKGSPPVLASTVSEQTIPQAMGATPSMANNPFVNRVGNPFHAAAEPVPKTRKVPASSVSSARTYEHQSKQVVEDPSTSRALVPISTDNVPDKESSEDAPNLRRYRYLLENPWLVQDLVLLEKKQITYHGSNHLDIELDIKPGQIPYQTIDLVRFHRIVASGKISVRLSETNMGPVVLVIHPSAVSRFESFTTSIKELPNGSLPLIDKLLNPLESTEYFRNYALLAHREQLCWELAGLLGSLDEQINNDEFLVIESVTSLHSESESFQTNTCSSNEGTDVGDLSEGPQQRANVNAATNDITRDDNDAEIVDTDGEQPTGHSSQPVPVTKIFNCQTCDKFYTSKRNYIRHLRTHEMSQATKAFLCDFCEKIFASKTRLNRHKLTHHKSNKVLSLGNPLVDQNGNNKTCHSCKKDGGCGCFLDVPESLPVSSNDEIDLNAKTRPIQLVTLERLRNSFNAGKLCVRVSEKYSGAVLIMRPEQEEQFSSDSVDVRLVEDVRRISPIAADLLNPQTLSEHAARCAMLTYDDQLDCWKLAGCLEPQISPASTRSTVSSIQETPYPSPPLRSEDSSDTAMTSPSRCQGVDPMNLLECVVGNSPEKLLAARESLANNSLRYPPSSGGAHQRAGPLFTNPLAEQSLEDLAVNHLISMIPQQVNQQIFDLLNTMDVTSVPNKPQHTGSRGHRLCTICGQVFADHSTFLRHKLIHDPSMRVHECDSCDYVSLRKDHLLKHVNRMHVPRAPNQEEFLS